jgi:tripartite-type tricarboxylate transporter receptor subunit TctC
MKHGARLMALALGILAVPSAAGTQDLWPSRTITFVVPYAAGGYTDLVGRLEQGFHVWHGEF